MTEVAVDAVATPDFAERATERNVVWAKMRGSTEWPAQVLSEEAAETFLRNAPRRGTLRVPVQFFGPATGAFLNGKDIHPWQEGLDRKWHMKANKKKRAQCGMAQALEYVRESVMPKGWWTRWHAVPWDPNSGKEAAALESGQPSELGADNNSGSGHSGRRALDDLVPPSPASVGDRGSDWNEEEEMRKRTSEYMPIDRNHWTSAPKLKMLKLSQQRKRKGDVAICSCSRSGDCSENCTNRATKFKCDPENCPCGNRCTNLPFDFIEHKKLEPFFTRNRGMGVKAMEHIRAGEFVVEYAGEVISDEQRKRRIAKGGSLLAGAYTMALDNGLYVDAYRKGNIARFVNSSCSPNCVVEKWTDAASEFSRLGIFAQTDIDPGQEVTYTYMLDAPEDMSEDDKEMFVCRCGAPNCRGTLVRRVSRHSIHNSNGLNSTEIGDQIGGQGAAPVQGNPPKKRVREECAETCSYARGREKVPPLHDTQSAAQ
ncbi:unnamed protein product [Ostreobium quekettii]|uniref:Histone-lysine N-methyltransferase n=1 Tax=Ostreobium quekettii TaxID=121088 RepID=A0A8S1IT26_9CHLO|nr:unnamed protein product [Ostreobium quekettii]